MDSHSASEADQGIFLELMKEHLTHGLAISSPLSCEEYSAFTERLQSFVHPVIQQTSDGETSSHLEQESEDNDSLPTPVVYKKRARVKFTSEQLEVLEATFEEHRYPTIDMVDDLVEQLQLPTQKITVWFQNRRARLKKSQQKLDDRPGRYDSGIHLDDDISRDSTSSPPIVSYPSVPNIGYIPSPAPSPYYLPPAPHTFYNPMWQNFNYSLPPASFPLNGSTPDNVPYHFGQYHSSFVFPEMGTYAHQREFYG